MWRKGRRRSCIIPFRDQNWYFDSVHLLKSQSYQQAKDGPVESRCEIVGTILFYHSQDQLHL